MNTCISNAPVQIDGPSRRPIPLHQIWLRFSTAGRGWLLGTCLLGILPSGNAVPILGNSIPDDSGSLLVRSFHSSSPVTADDTSFYAIAFTMPGQSYTLTDVTLRLSESNYPSVASISLLLDSGSSTHPLGNIEAVIGSTALGPGIDDYTFTPGSPVTLVADTKYWLSVAALSGGEFYWMNASDAPTGVAALSGFYHQFSFSSDPPGTGVHRSADPFNQRFEIRGELVVATAVPDAGSALPLLGLSFAGLAWFRHRRRPAVSPVGPATL